ncbi:MAG: outer membrane lipoprotein-sorting protein, partial [Draconibacterium sp.]|nr:outer membrane lipoprotein-sorting protein [Draconibacterium sp.]
MSIIKKVDQQYKGEDRISDSTFLLINKRGKKRIRKIVRYWKQYAGINGYDEKSIIFFTHPREARGTAFLNWDYIAFNQDNDQWLYLSSIGRIKRLSTSEKEDSFMGTDFTFDDMGGRKVDEDEHVFIKKAAYQGVQAYIIESTTKEQKYIYRKKIHWIDAEKFVTLKTIFYDSNGRHFKTQTNSWELKNDLWVITEMEMKNLKTSHKTLVSIRNFK